MELGGNYLNTSFSGTKSAQLSGIPDLFPILEEDMGTAMSTEDGETCNQSRDI